MPENKEELKRVQGEKNKAPVTERASANKAFEKMIRSYSRQEGSFTSRLEATYRFLGISSEYYHGGKFNGVNCIQIMDRSKELFHDATTLLLEMPDPTLETIEDLQKTVQACTLNFWDALMPSGRLFVGWIVGFYPLMHNWHSWRWRLQKERGNG
jgi:hypothetical protein